LICNQKGLEPQYALINDISDYLTDFYELVKIQNQLFKNYLREYNSLRDDLLSWCEKNYNSILELYLAFKMDKISKEYLSTQIADYIGHGGQVGRSFLKYKIILDDDFFLKHLHDNIIDKISRTIINERKASYNDADLKENLITGFMSGMYMYFRSVYNDILLDRIVSPNKEYTISNFYFIREYCYGSMFRYNRKGEFNIPYGGMSYNRKNFMSKIDNLFSDAVKELFSGTTIYCDDFADFIDKIDLNESDFMFLDPPYDTEFSEYEGRAFTQDDQRRLAKVLLRTKAKFILIIKNTDFIHSLYKDKFKIYYFDKTYTYNVRSRNERDVEHLIITNITNKQMNFIF
jgi:DNA adenine methylase